MTGTIGGPSLRRRRGFTLLELIASMLVISVVLAGACLVGCVDRRISLDALQELEEQMAQEVAQQTEVEVEPAELALTELQPYKVGPRDVLSLTLHGATEPYSENAFRVRVHDDGTVRGCGWMPAVGSVYEITDIDDGTIIGRRVTDGHEVIQAPPTPDAPLLILTAAP